MVDGSLGGFRDAESLVGDRGSEKHRRIFCASRESTVSGILPAPDETLAANMSAALRLLFRSSSIMRADERPRISRLARAWELQKLLGRYVSALTG
jgi:hypothetical protein